MTSCFTFGGRDYATPLVLLNGTSYSRFKKKLSAEQLQWLENNDFAARHGQLCGVPAPDGSVERFLIGVGEIEDPFAIADLPLRLPAGLYSLEGSGVKANLESLAIGWGLGAYQFTRYKSATREPARLKIPNSADQQRIDEIVAATFRTRDMINTPAEDMMPEHIALIVAELAQTHDGKFQEIVGDSLLAENYPCIHTVGRASVHQPRLIELQWGDPAHPSVTLVGKGISFDSGGLDIKPASGYPFT